MTLGKVTTCVAAALLLAAAPSAAQPSGRAPAGPPRQGAFAGPAPRQDEPNPPAPPPEVVTGPDVFQPNEPDWIEGDSLGQEEFLPYDHAGQGGEREMPIEFFGGGGDGKPPQRESWLYRPFSASVFLGGMLVDDPLPGQVNAGTGFFTGFRFGWDFSRAWGVESRFGFSKTGTEDPNNVLQLGDEKIFLFDINWLWYPTGDTRWRPYLSAGLGMADINLMSDQTTQLHETLFGVPLGGGLKYRVGNRLAFRVELLDNIAFGAGNRLSDMHNVSISAGFEWRLGGARRAYWPWNPSRNWW